MISPFMPVNARTIRAERWAAARHIGLTFATLALTIGLGIAAGHLIQKSALNAAATAAQAEAMKGM